MRALLLVDLQNDFLPGGALAVPRGDEVPPLANRLLAQYPLLIATQDWHPPTHGSFAANHPGRQPGEVVELNGLRQVLWPTHCVQETPGAALAPALETGRLALVIRKGLDPAVDSYSAFFDNGRRRATGLEACLRERGVDEVHLLGLATDYCVKFTALDACALGFRVAVLAAACRGVDLAPGDSARALEEMRRAGAEILSSGLENPRGAGLQG